MPTWMFWDYKPNDNVIRAWLDTLPKQAKQKFNNGLLHLAALPLGSWQRPIVDTLTDECAGLFEIRVRLGRVRYRLLRYNDGRPAQATRLHGFTTPNDKVDPTQCQEAYRRRDHLEQNPEERRVLHDYG